MRNASRSLIPSVVLAAAFASPGAWAAKPPADPCSLLPAADLAKVLGRPFGPPESTVAPRPFKNTATPVPGVADETYIDSKHGLHARKGNVRFFIEFAGMNTAAATKDQQLSALATAISGRI